MCGKWSLCQWQVIRIVRCNCLTMTTALLIAAFMVFDVLLITYVLWHKSWCSGICEREATDAKVFHSTEGAGCCKTSGSNCVAYVLFCSIAILDRRVGHTMNIHLSLSSVILIDSSTGSPVHVLMLSIQAVPGLPHLHATGIVPCIIYFSCPFPSFVMVWS